MRVVKNTPDLLILRYRPIAVWVFCTLLLAIYLGVTGYALITFDWATALVCGLVCALIMATERKQELSVGVYLDRTHETAAVQTRHLLSKRTTIYPLADVQGIALAQNGLEFRPSLALNTQPAHRLTRDYIKARHAHAAAAVMQAWLGASALTLTR